MKSLSSTSAVQIKLLTDFVQILGLVTSLPSRWPENLLDIFQIQGNVNNPNNLMATSDCTFGLVLTEINVYFKKLILAVFITILLPIFIYIFWTLYSMLTKMSKSDRNFRLETSLIIVFYTFQPSFINLFFSGLTCRNIENTYYLQKYIKQKCWDSMHLYILFIFVIPCLSLWMFGVPLLLLRTIHYRAKKGLSMEAYSYITYGYRDTFFFWEFIIMINKYFFIIVITFIFEDIISILSLFIVSFFFLCLQVYLKPYGCDSFNRVALMSRISTHTIIFCSMASNVEGSEKWMIVFLLLLGSIFCLFFAFWIHSFLQFQTKFVRIWNKFCPSKSLHFKSTEMIIDSLNNISTLKSLKTKRKGKTPETSILDCRSSQYLEQNWVAAKPGK
jgi:hypothetical protein